jgi:hypothetical protein
MITASKCIDTLWIHEFQGVPQFPNVCLPEIIQFGFLSLHFSEFNTIRTLYIFNENKIK